MKTCLDYTLPECSREVPLLNIKVNAVVFFSPDSRVFI